MKKLLSIFLILTLLMIFSVSGTALAQDPDPTEEPAVEATEEPVAEPTGEPPADPTEEPTADPTEEPTVEATEEPTVEATEEPTVEATEEPTVEPTEEPTVEPTEEPTVEATEEPTAEPTEEPTAEPTEEPTAEPTEEPTAEPTEVEAAGDIGTSAVAGSWTTQYIGVANLGAGPANITLQMFNIDGGANPPDILKNNVDKSIVILSSELTDGRYSGVIQSSEPVAVGVIQANTQYKSGDMYLGVGNPSQTVVIPTLYKNSYGLVSSFYVQNAHSATQDITVYVYELGDVPNATYSNARASRTYNIQPNEAVAIDLGTSSHFSGYAGGDGSSGFGFAVGADGNVAVVSSIFQNRGTADTSSEMAFAGFGGAQEGTTIIVPLFYRNLSYWESGLNAVNRSTSSQTTITMQFVAAVDPQNAPSCPGGTYTYDITAQPGQVVNFYGPYLGVQGDTAGDDSPIPQGCYGAATLTSSGGIPIVASVTNSRFGFGSSYIVSGASLDAATTSAVIPLTFSGAFGSSAWSGGIDVYNQTGGNRVRATFYASGSATGVNLGTSAALGAGASKNFYLPDLTTGKNPGAVFIESLDGGNILANSVSAYGNDMSGTMGGVNYTP
jgi:hypothetical protein